MLSGLFDCCFACYCWILGFLWFNLVSVFVLFYGLGWL